MSVRKQGGRYRRTRRRRTPAPAHSWRGGSLPHRRAAGTTASVLLFQPGRVRLPRNQPAGFRSSENRTTAPGCDRWISDHRTHSSPWKTENIEIDLCDNRTRTQDRSPTYRRNPAGEPCFRTDRPGSLLNGCSSHPGRRRKGFGPRGFLILQSTGPALNLGELFTNEQITRLRPDALLNGCKPRCVFNDDRRTDAAAHLNVFEPFPDGALSLLSVPQSTLGLIS